VIIAMDVGNTTVAVGVIRDGDVELIARAPTAQLATADAIGTALADALADTGPSRVEEIVAASVVPSVAIALSAYAQSQSIRLLMADDTTIPIPIRVDEPSSVGDDRLVNAYAASRLYGKPTIVIDLGTATTFDVVAVDGAFVGGAIAAGAGLGVEALAKGTAQLPRVPLVMPVHAIGRDTVSSMQSGAIIGHVGLIHVLVRAISDELALDGGDPAKVILTGGLSNADWARAVPGVDAIDPLLTLRGLALLHAEIGRRQSVAPA
jgi:type III pantothenate kinase